MTNKKKSSDEQTIFYNVKYIIPGGKQGTHRAYTKKGADDFAKRIKKEFKAITWIKKI